MFSHQTLTLQKSEVNLTILNNIHRLAFEELAERRQFVVVD
jgi:hypothetical protein